MDMGDAVAASTSRRTTHTGSYVPDDLGHIGVGSCYLIGATAAPLSAKIRPAQCGGTAGRV